MVTVAGRNFHEAATIFPRMKPRERRETVASIRQLGVLEPIVYVVRPGGPEYIDGINRAEICAELGIDCPEEEYLVDDGKGGVRPPTDLEILDYCMARNKERRHLSSSQKAAIAVLAGDLQLRYRAKAQAGMRTTSNQARMAQAEVELPASDVELAGDVAAKVAEMHGTNRAYIFKMVAVHERDPDKTLEVRDGNKSVEAAYAEMMPSPELALLFDALGKMVPADREDVFADRGRFTQAQRLARELLTEVDYLATAPGGAYFQTEAAACRAAIDQVLASLRQHTPHSSVCPRCLGLGKLKGLGKKGKKLACDLCDGHGWVDHSRWYLASPDEKAAAAEKVGSPGG
jgi:hypothetical protein